jgi:hypothetical protein
MSKWQASVGMSELQACIYWEIVGLLDHTNGAAFFNLRSLADGIGGRVNYWNLYRAAESGGRFFVRGGTAGAHGKARSWRIILPPPTEQDLARFAPSKREPCLRKVQTRCLQNPQTGSLRKVQTHRVLNEGGA